ncbi:hypothetical protein [Allorhizocola rhizosphaerae]|uniref:hypothetical protein n=1 Tax=Allorhizocola rhizosphaerae TaxID=1872709 RepID=UPI0013C378A2|nr:hypothetical protein [Allorhizocola rhizosphaerae]
MDPALTAQPDGLLAPRASTVDLAWLEMAHRFGLFDRETARGRLAPPEPES